MDRKPLAVCRASVQHIIPYSEQQKLELLDAIKAGFKASVHQDSMIMKELDQLSSKAGTISDLAFHYILAYMFLNIEDESFLYSIPGPHGSYKLQLGIEFTRIADGDQLKIAVSNILDGCETQMIDVGDELILVDGVSFEDFVNEHQRHLKTSNKESAGRKAIKYLVERDCSMYPLPNQDHVQFTLRNKDGDNYKANLAWIASAKQSQLDYYHHLESNDVLSEDTLLDQESEDHISNDESLHNAEIQIGNFTADFTSSTFSGNIGVLQIHQFPNCSKEFIDEIANVLLNDFSDTKGLLIDLRNAKGSNFLLANYLAQLFCGIDFSRSKSRVFASEVTEKLFGSDRMINWEAQDMSELHDDVPKYMLTIGQVYFNPVAVLVNADISGPIDCFASILKSQPNIKIFGEETCTPQFNTKSFSLMDLSKLVPGVVHLPAFSKFKPQASFGIIQHSFFKSEDTKVELLTPTLEDIISQNYTSQYSRIINYLEDISNSLFFGAEPFDISDCEYGSHVKFVLKVRGLSELAVLNERLETISEVNVSDVSCLKQVVLAGHPGVKKLGLHGFYIIGKDESGKKLVNAIRLVRFIPPRKDRIILSQFPITLKEFSTSAAMVNNLHHSLVSKEQQWNLDLSGEWIVGFGNGYGRNIDTSLTLFAAIDSPTPITMSVQAVLDISEDDSFSAQYVDSTGVVSIFSLSKSQTVNHSFAFSPKDDFELRLLFRSKYANPQGKVILKSLNLSTIEAVDVSKKEVIGKVVQHQDSGCCSNCQVM